VVRRAIARYGYRRPRSFGKQSKTKRTATPANAARKKKKRSRQLKPEGLKLFLGDEKCPDRNNFTLTPP
jgi:hypothetical protein